MDKGVLAFRFDHLRSVRDGGVEPGPAELGRTTECDTCEPGSAAADRSLRTTLARGGRPNGASVGATAGLYGRSLPDVGRVKGHEYGDAL
jgi:hypothetical protein